MTTRLNKYKRERLQEFARKSIEFPELQATETAAFDALRARIVEINDGLATPEEMVILRKFNATRRLGTAEIVIPHDRENAGHTVSFCLCPRDVSEPVSRHHHRRGYCHRNHCPDEEMIEVANSFHPGGSFRLDATGVLSAIGAPAATRQDLNDELFELYLVWNAAVLAHNVERGKALRDLSGLFKRKRNFEDIVEIWPPAAGAASLVGAAEPINEADEPARFAAIPVKAA